MKEPPRPKKRGRPRKSESDASDDNNASRQVGGGVHSIAQGGVSHPVNMVGVKSVVLLFGKSMGTIIWSSPDFLLDDHPGHNDETTFLN